MPQAIPTYSGHCAFNFALYYRTHFPVRLRWKLCRSDITIFVISISDRYRWCCRCRRRGTCAPPVIYTARNIGFHALSLYLEVRIQNSVCRYDNETCKEEAKKKNIEMKTTIQKFSKGIQTHSSSLFSLLSLVFFFCFSSISCCGTQVASAHAPSTEEISILKWHSTIFFYTPAKPKYFAETSMSGTTTMESGNNGTRWIGRTGWNSEAVESNIKKRNCHCFITRECVFE